MLSCCDRLCGSVLSGHVSSADRVLHHHCSIDISSMVLLHGSPGGLLLVGSQVAAAPHSCSL